MGAHAAEIVVDWGHAMTDHIKNAMWWINAGAKRTLIFAQAIGVMLLALLIMMAFESRLPPVEALPTAPMTVHAGDWNTLLIPVRRDMSRRCSISYEVILIDSVGVRFPMIGGDSTPDSIQEMEARHPGVIPLGVFIPPLKHPWRGGISEGPAELLITRTSACNPLQELIPIRSRSSIALLILP